MGEKERRKKRINESKTKKKKEEVKSNNKRKTIDWNHYFKKCLQSFKVNCVSNIYILNTQIQKYARDSRSKGAQTNGRLGVSGSCLRWYNSQYTITKYTKSIWMLLLSFLSVIYNFIKLFIMRERKKWNKKDPRLKLLKNEACFVRRNMFL